MGVAMVSQVGVATGRGGQVCVATGIVGVSLRKTFYS